MRSFAVNSPSQTPAPDLFASVRPASFPNERRGRFGRNDSGADGLYPKAHENAPGQESGAAGGATGTKLAILDMAADASLP